jgi:aspartate aminotransferase
MKLSNRITGMQESPVRKLVPIATRIKKEGKKVYHLNIGQPDIETPQAFMDAIHNMDTKVIAYSFSQGEPSLLNAISNYYKRSDINMEPSDILITNGGSEALINTCIAICDEGDDVLVPEPFYTNYNGFTKGVNVNVVPITTKAEDGFHLPGKEEIVKAITPKTKAILFSNPGNPTGCIYTRAELEMLAEIAVEHNLWIVSDEVYRGFAYDGLEAISFGNIDGVEDRVILVDSVSKRYSACGARIGCVASKNTDFIAQYVKLCQSRLCVPTLEQIGAAALYELPDSYVDEMREVYENRRNIVYETLKNIDGVVCEKPTGAFYVVAKLPVENAEEFVIWLLEEFDVDGETIMMAPAEGFYATEGLGRDEVRIAYILNSEDLKKSMNILDLGLKAYKNR